MNLRTLIVLLGSNNTAIGHPSVAEVAEASVEYEELTCKQMSIKEIYTATENLRLSNIIGQGIAGTRQY
jgi:hypothetical protein